MTQTMKAWFAVPGPEGAVFELRESPVAAPGAGQVMVAVRAAGTNRGELIRGAALRPGSAPASPARAGTEFAGEIAALGDGVSGWKPGDRVMGRAVGSYAQFVIAHQRALMRVPGGMSWAEAAALRALGAHEVVDTRDAGKWVDAVMRATEGRGVDVIIDHVGGPMLADNIRVLALKARLVSVGRNAGRVGDCDLDEVARKRASIIGVTFRTRTPEESLVCSERFAAHLLDAVAKGALKPVLDRTFPFDRLPDAHKYMLSDAQTGKIVLAVDDA